MPDTQKVLFTIEHEVRSLPHPMFLRPLVNRNAGQRQATFQRGRDAFVPGMKARGWGRVINVSSGAGARAAIFGGESRYCESVLRALQGLGTHGSHGEHCQPRLHPHRNARAYPEKGRRHEGLAR